MHSSRITLSLTCSVALSLTAVIHAQTSGPTAPAFVRSGAVIVSGDSTELSSTELSLLDHFQDEKIPVYESLVTQGCSGIRMVVLI